MVMGDVCGDFLRRRVVAKVWPPLVRTLESLASQSILTNQFYRLVDSPLSVCQINSPSHYKIQMITNCCESLIY